MSVLKKPLLLLLCLCAALSLMGCYSYRDPEELDIATGAAIDLDADGTYLLATEIIGNSSGNGSKQQMESLIIDSKGVSFSDAVNNTIKKANEKLYWADAQIVIFSEDVAKQGIGPLIDWLLRDSEPRLNLYLAVSRAGTARALLQPPSLGTEIRSFALSKILDNADVNLGETAVYRLYEIANTIGEDGISATMPAFNVVLNEGKETVSLAGTAVFQEDKLIGYLGDDESKYLNVIRNEIDTGIFNFTMPYGDQQSPNLSVEVYEMKTSIEPSIEDGAAQILVKTKGKVAVNNNNTHVETTDKVAQEFSGFIEREMERNMLDLIRMVQQRFDADIFGFGRKIQQKYPEFFRHCGSDWGSTFKTLPVTVQCEIPIIRSGLWSNELKGD